MCAYLHVYLVECRPKFVGNPFVLVAVLGILKKVGALLLLYRLFYRSLSTGQDYSD